MQWPPCRAAAEAAASPARAPHSVVLDGRLGWERRETVAKLARKHQILPDQSPEEDAHALVAIGLHSLPCLWGGRCKKRRVACWWARSVRRQHGARAVGVGWYA